MEKPINHCPQQCRLPPSPYTRRESSYRTVTFINSQYQTEYRLQKFALTECLPYLKVHNSIIVGLEEQVTGIH